MTLIQRKGSSQIEAEETIFLDICSVKKEFKLFFLFKINAIFFRSATAMFNKIGNENQYYINTSNMDDLLIRAQKLQITQERPKTASILFKNKKPSIFLLSFLKNNFNF